MNCYITHKSNFNLFNIVFFVFYTVFLVKCCLKTTKGGFCFPALAATYLQEAVSNQLHQKDDDG